MRTLRCGRHFPSMKTYSDRVFTLRARVSLPKQQLTAVLLTGLLLFMVGGGPCWYRAQAQPLSQPGSVDDSFIAAAGLEGWRHQLQCIVPLSDGRLLIGGSFTNYAGVPRPGLARLEADGCLDDTFAPAFESRTEDSAGITAVAQQPDGRILAGGWFTTLDGTRRNFVRLEGDGSIDESFAVDLSANSTVQAIALQSDGRILIGGSFHRVNGVARQCLARLQSDGGLDPSFVPARLEIGDDWYITSLGLQSNGQVIVGGHIFDVPWESYRGLVRLNHDGNLDTEFSAHVRADFAVFQLFVQPDDKILVDSGVTAYGLHVGGPSRLNSDGTLDTSFRAPATLGWVENMALAPDGKVLIGGYDRAAQLNPDGSLNLLFETVISGGDDNRVWAVAVQPDGQVLVEGDFTHVNELPVPGFARLRGDVTPRLPVLGQALADRTSYAGQTAGFTARAAGTGTLTYQWLWNDQPMPDSTSATLTLENVQAADAGHYAVRISNDAGSVTSPPAALEIRPVPQGAGSLDVRFDTSAGHTLSGLGGAYGQIQALLVEPSGQIVIGGAFVGCNGWQRKNLARFDSQGLLDLAFNEHRGPDGPLYSLARASDGAILIGGAFRTFDDQPHGSLVRLTPDGDRDADFAVDVRLDADAGQVWAVLPLGDGRVLVGGYFTAINGIPRAHLARLNHDGSIDSSFDASAQLGSRWNGVRELCLLPGDRILAGGHVGPIGRLLARFDPDGNFDPEFASQLTGDSLRDLAVSPSGKIYVAGELDLPQGNRDAIVRLNPDGSPDDTFEPLVIGVSALAVQPDDRLLIAGGFESVRGTPRNHVARLEPDGSLDETFNPNITSDQWGWYPGLIQAQADGSVWLTGRICFWGGKSSALIKLGQDGVLDEAWHNQAGEILLTDAATVRTILRQADGRLLIGGDFDYFDHHSRANLARLHPNGSLDHEFTTDWLGELDVGVMLMQPDGKLLVGPRNNYLGGWGRTYAGLVRLLPDGNVDSSFVSPWSETWNMRLHALALQADGKIIAGGEFQGGLVRLTPQGGFDADFEPPELPAYDGDAVHTVLLDQQEKIIVGGTANIGLFRLLPDGTQDETFVSDVRVDGAITVMLRQPDGGLLVGLTAGSIRGAPETPTPKLIRLRPDGAFDYGFATCLEEAPSALALETDQHILAAETDYRTGGTVIHRLNPDGSVDSAYQATAGQTGEWSTVYALLIEPNGQLLVGGTFSRINDQAVQAIARLNSGEQCWLCAARPADDGPFQLLLSGTPGMRWVVEVSADLMHWSTLTVVTNLQGDVQCTDPDWGLYPHRFYRASPPPPVEHSGTGNP
jgi:uncharacterized delta-60 repeat protein